MKFVDKMANKLLPVMSKVNSQRHLLAIRDAFIVTMPLIMAASFLILLNALLFSNEWVNQFINLSKFSNLAVIVNNGTMNILAIVVCYQIGVNLAHWYVSNKRIDDPAFNEIHAGILSVACMFILMPLNTSVTLTNGKMATAMGVYSSNLTSASGLATAMICALIATEIFVHLAKFKKMKIHMPDTDPPAVSTSFNSLVPEVLVVFIFGIVAFALYTTTGLDVPALINLAIQTPLKGFVLSAAGTIFLQFVSDVLWVFGMHGSDILAPIRQAPLLQSIQDNMEAFAHHQAIPNIITEPFINSFGLIGGGGCILPLLIAIFIFSKRKDFRSVGKFGLPTSLFNITEPVMFGLPVVLNPILMIPCALIPSINVIIAYILTVMGIVGKTVAQAPWITPPVLMAFLSTGGNWMAAILTILLIILDVFLFMPFVIAANKAVPEE